MMLFGELSIGLLDFGGGSRRRDAEQVVGVFRHFRLPSVGRAGTRAALQPLILAL